MTTKANALIERVTADLVAEIEAGAGAWSMPWQALAEAGSPVSVDGRPYRGVNAFILGMLGARHGYSGTWGTYRAWQSHDAQVRKGSKGSEVILWKPWEREERDPSTGETATRSGVLMRTFHVFPAEMVDGGERWITPPEARDTAERIEHAELYFSQVPAVVRHGGNRAYYTPAADMIQLPTREAFHEPAFYYSTRAHESVHWTAHPKRCDRDLSGRFGSDAYAVEELIAELGAAFWSAKYAVSPADRSADHAAYLAAWLRVLKAEPKTLVTVTARAQAAVDHLDSYQVDAAAVAA